MKKFLFLVGIMLGIVSTSAALDLTIGTSIHYEPTAAKFECGADEWTYTQDIASFGVLAEFKVHELISIRFTERLIMGANEHGSNIVPIGQNFSTKIFLHKDQIVLNYECESYWQSEDVSLYYQMSISPVHRVSLDFNVPLFNINLF